MNYFDLFEIPAQLKVDEHELHKKSLDPVIIILPITLRCPGVSGRMNYKQQAKHILYVKNYGQRLDLQSIFAIYSHYYENYLSKVIQILKVFLAERLNPGLERVTYLFVFGYIVDPHVPVI